MYLKNYMLTHHGHLNTVRSLKQKMGTASLINKERKERREEKRKVRIGDKNKNRTLSQDKTSAGVMLRLNSSSS